MLWTETDMRTACEEVAVRGRLKYVATKYRIPPLTLRGRLRGRLPHVVAHQDTQRLSMIQEDDLAAWVLFQASIGEPPTYTQIKDLA